MPFAATPPPDPWLTFGPDVLSGIIAGVVTGIITGLIVGALLGRQQRRAARASLEREYELGWLSAFCRSRQGPCS